MPGSASNRMVAAEDKEIKEGNCEGCDQTLTNNHAWLWPWCFECGKKYFGFPDSQQGKETWEKVTRDLREKILAPKTMQIYERASQKAEWPLDSPYKIIKYLDTAAASNSSLKQWIAAAKRIHKVRNWGPPIFNHPMVEAFIEVQRKRPVNRDTSKRNPPVFEKTELQAIFDCLGENEHPTDLRNWAIITVQLFGVRRANEVLDLKKTDIGIKGGEITMTITATKTDKRKRGSVIRMPKKSCFGFNPTKLLARYIRTTKSRSKYLFPIFDPDEKRYKEGRITLRGWNLALRRICT